MAGPANYPSGFSEGITIRGVPLRVAHPGEVFWVNNSSVVSKGGIGGSNNNNGSYKKPFSTLAYAQSNCVASRGDIVFVMPGHAETFSSAAALDFSKAGVAYIGLGVGSLRPTITLDTIISASVRFSAANISLKNFVISANFADITSATIATTAKNLALDNVEFAATAINMNFLSIFTPTGAANTVDGFSMYQTKWLEPDAATVAAIIPTAGHDRWFIQDHLQITGAATQDKAALIEGGALNFTNFYAGNVRVSQTAHASSTAAALIISSGTAWSGLVEYSFINDLNTTGDLLVTAGTKLKFRENFVTGVADKSGFIIPARDS